MVRLLISLLAVGLTGCSTIINQHWWSDGGHARPDLACSSYMDVVLKPKVLLYLYYGTPDEGQLLMPSGNTIQAAYTLEGTDHVWQWDFDPHHGAFRYALVVNAKGFGYYYDFAKAAPGQTSISKHQDYKCSTV